MMVVIEEFSNRVKDILLRAKKERIKGRYYVYEQYKAELWDACTSNKEYSEAVIELANALKV